MSESKRTGLPVPPDEPREPTDDELYNGYGMEGGIGYDAEAAYDEHDPRL